MDAGMLWSRARSPLDRLGAADRVAYVGVMMHNQGLDGVGLKFADILGKYRSGQVPWRSSGGMRVVTIRRWYVHGSLSSHAQCTL